VSGSWICGHSQIWAVKADPGPGFPTMHMMRDAIWSDEPLDQIGWLPGYPSYRDLGGQGDFDVPIQWSYDRCDPEKTETFWYADESVEAAIPDKDDRPRLARGLYLLGWPVDLKNIKDVDLSNFVVYFQRSTIAHRKKNPEKVLKVDGVAGPKTMAALNFRLSELGLK
jgi:hypothetical protein